MDLTKSYHEEKHQKSYLKLVAVEREREFKGQET